MEITLDQNQTVHDPLVERSNSTRAAENESNIIVFDSQYKLTEYIQNNEDQSAKQYPLRCKANLDRAHINPIN